jgi:hypothetical protein
MEIMNYRLVLIILWIFLLLPQYLAAQKLPPCSDHLQQNLLFQLERLKIVLPLYSLEKLLVENKAIPKERKKLAQDRMDFLGKELDVCRTRIAQLRKQGAQRIEIRRNDLPPEMLNHLKYFQAMVENPRFQGLYSSVFFDEVWKDWSHNADQQSYGYFKGLFYTFPKTLIIGLGLAGLEVIKTAEDSSTAMTFGFFDPEAGQYYKFKSQIWQNADEGKLAEKFKGIPVGIAQGLYAATAGKMAAGSTAQDPFKRGEAFGEAASFIIMTVMSTRVGQGPATVGAGEVGANAGTTAIPIFTGIIPSSGRSAAMAIQVVEVDVGQAAAEIAAFAAEGIKTGGTCAMISAATSAGGSVQTPNIANKFMPKEKPADISPPEVTKLINKVEDDIMKLPDEEFLDDLQAWMDDVNKTPEGTHPSSLRKGYLPGMGTNPRTLEKVRELADDLLNAEIKPVVDIVKDETFSRYAHSQARNIWSQMCMPTHPSMAPMMIGKYEYFKDGLVGRIMIERLFKMKDRGVLKKAVDEWAAKRGQ